MTTTTRTHKEIKTMNNTTINTGANVDALEALKARLAEQGEQVNNAPATRVRRSRLWVDSAEGNNTFAEAILMLAMEHVEYRSARVAVGGAWQDVTPENYQDLKDNEVRYMTFVHHCQIDDEDDYTVVEIASEGDYYVAQAEINMAGTLTAFYSGVEYKVDADAIVRYAEGKSLVAVVKTALEKINRRSNEVKIVAMTPAR